MSPALLITPALILVAFGISFFFHGGHDTAFAPAIFLIMVAGLVSVLPALKHVITFPRGACVLLTLAFWGYLSVSLIWSSVPFASLVTWLNLTVLPVILLALLCTAQRETLIRHSVLALVAATSVAALLVLWQFFVDGLQRASGPLPNPNNMATLLNLSLLPAMAYALAGEKRYRLMASGVSILLFTALLATGSRGGLICFLLGAILIVIALYKPLMTDRKSAGIFAAALMVIFAGFYTLTHSALEQSLPIFGDPAADYSSFERLAIWKGALLMLRDHWLGGTGLGTFYLYYQSYRLEGDAVSLGHWAHSDGLQFGVEAGMAAMLLFYAAIIAWLMRGAQALMNISTDNPRRVLIAGSMATLLALAVHAHIEFQFYVLANLIMAAVMMAALYHLTSEDEDQSYINITLEKNDRLIWSGTLIATALLVCFTLLSSAAGIHFLNRAHTAMDKGNIDDFATNIALSRQYAPRSFADADVQLAGLYADLLAQSSSHMTADDRIAAYHDALQLLNNAQAANPAWADIDHKRAKLYARANPAQEPDHIVLAIDSWTTALRKNPLHYRAREEFTRHLLKQGRAEDAYIVLQDGLKRPMTPAARSNLNRLAAQIEPLIAAKRQFQQQQAPAE